MNQDPILITTQYEAEKFEIFLALPDNHRILFSDKYGSGKMDSLKDTAEGGELGDSRILN